MAYGLLDRIYDHVFAEGWLHEGSVCLDIFGGIGSTGILGAYRKVQVIIVEIEPRFTTLAEANFKLHDNAWRKLGCPRPVMIQGDSRKLSEIIGQLSFFIPYSGPKNTKFTCVLSSPPYAELPVNDNQRHSRTKRDAKVMNGPTPYGPSPANLGNLKPGDVSMVISSPPFQASLTDKPSAGVRKMHGANMGRSALGDGYGNTPGNIAALPPGEIAAIISSPPFENCLQTKDKEFNRKKAIDSGRNPDGFGCQGGMSDYGNTKGQIGAEQGDTFWQAAKVIIEQCYQILKPGGHAIWVVKAFVRKGKLVDFPGDWRRLCEAIGFETLHEHHASFVKESQEPTFFGPETKRKSKKSFFRRLCESKGSPEINWETVFCMRKAGPI